MRTLDGVEWITDSKGTNPNSVEKALLSETRPVVLIAGGKDKGFEYEMLTELVAKKCRAVVTLGEMADRIEALWKTRLPIRNSGRSLEKAVQFAREQAQPWLAVPLRHVAEHLIVSAILLDDVDAVLDGGLVADATWDRVVGGDPFNTRCGVALQRAAGVGLGGVGGHLLRRRRIDDAYRPLH